MDEMMLQARQHEKNIQMKRLQEEKIENLKNKDVLFQQMYEKRE